MAAGMAAMVLERWPRATPHLQAESPCLAWASETSEPIPSDTLPPVRSQLLLTRPLTSLLFWSFSDRATPWWLSSQVWVYGTFILNHCSHCDLPCVCGPLFPVPSCGSCVPSDLGMFVYILFKAHIPWTRLLVFFISLFKILNARNVWRGSRNGRL